MKQLVWSPSSINFGSKKKGESVTAESTLSITEGSALLTPGKISPLPGADYPVQIKNTEGNLHIHPAFSFAAARYYLTSAGALTTDRDTAEIYLGNAGAGAGLPFLPVPITLVITTPPGEIDPADPLTINYTSSAVLWVSVFLSINGSEWFFYDTFNATGTLDIDLSGWSLEHGDIITVKVQDSESSSFYDTAAFTAMVKNIVIDSIGTIYLIGEFEDGVDYYALPNGDITTDITGIYLGVGNSDGDIDLNIIEYTVEITSPLDSADIGLNVPFTFEATTNVQDGRSLTVVAYSAEVPSGVALGVFEISGGAITGSVTVSELDGFTIGAVQLLAWYSPVVSTIKTVDVTTKTATITNVASTPASPEPATNFVFSGDSTYLVGKELTLQYSTDDSTWLPLGVATVQPDGTWSKADCQIATAGTYYLRAIYGAEVVESASISVSVASGYVAGSRILVANRENTYIAQLSVDSGANFADIGGAIADNTRGVALSADGKYGLLGGSPGYLIKINDGVASSAVETSSDWSACLMSDSGQYQVGISSAGFYFSNDYGATWTAKETAKIFVTGCMNPTGQYIAIFSNASARAYFSNDYGVTWVERASTGGVDKCCITANGFRVYYGIISSGSSVYRCTSNGATQTLIRNATGCINLVCHDSGLVISQRFGSYTDVSLDHGATWSTISTGITTFIGGSGKLSPDGNIFFSCQNLGYVLTLQSPWTTYQAQSYRPYAGMIDCTYDGKYVVCSRNELGTGGIGYSDDYGANWSTKLSTSRTWSKIAISTKKLPS